MTPLTIGIIGTGNISDAYLHAAPGFPILKILACADANPDVAAAKAAQWGIEALSVAALLADPRIDIVLNLTTPQHHVAVGLQALAAGKHVYAEKPLAVSFADALRLVDAAKQTGLRVGSAPDTFLGGSHQTARRAIDAGAIGDVIAGSAHMMVPGHERWHPNPDFYYQPGGGPMLDMGPYYLTCLINLLGPVRCVTGMQSTPRQTRTIGSGPRMGESFGVAVPTHISGLLDFANGAQIIITTSFDVWKHGHNHIELYGSTGSMIVSDPNQFQGDIQVSDKGGDWAIIPQVHAYGGGNHRILGLADMAHAINDDRPHRASLDLALHVLEVMEAIATSATTGTRQTMAHGCDRPAALDVRPGYGTNE
jgi:predicted dehydrogenase